MQCTRANSCLESCVEIFRRLLESVRLTYALLPFADLAKAPSYGDPAEIHRSSRPSILDSTGLEPARQDLLDPVNLGRHFACRQACILAVQEIQLLNHFVTLAADIALAGGVLARSPICKIRQLLDPDKLALPCAQLPAHVGRSRIVSDSIDPGAQRASVVETGETSPESNVNLLQQVAARLVVGLVGASQAFECCAIRHYSFFEGTFFTVREVWHGFDLLH